MATANVGLGELESELLPESELHSEFEAESELESEFESQQEFEFESELELSPIRRIYPDAMMEHMAHAAAESENEQEAAEHFLPLIPLVASKLLPLAVKALPKVAKAIPKIARAVHRVTPQLTRDIGQISRALFRRPQGRRLVRLVPSIARRTVYRIARQAASGRPVTPGVASQVLRQQARWVTGHPRYAHRVLRRSAALDRGYHRAAGIPAPSPAVSAGAAYSQPAARCCSCCGQSTVR